MGLGLTGPWVGPQHTKERKRGQDAGNEGEREGEREEEKEQEHPPLPHPLPSTPTPMLVKQCLSTSSRGEWGRGEGQAIPK